MKKFELENLGFQMLNKLKERINYLEEDFHKADFQLSINRVGTVLGVLDNIKKIIIRLKIYQEIYDVSG